MISKTQVKNALKKVNDPELGHNLVDLGLIYDIKISPITNRQPLITIVMTLTTPGCPLGPVFVDQIKETVAAAVNLKQADIEVNIVFDPPWSAEAMSLELRLELGL